LYYSFNRSRISTRSNSFARQSPYQRCCRYFEWLFLMVGNAAGPIFNVYILTQQLKKESMIGTVAWFFFLVNLIKLPFHIFLWGTINNDTAKFTVFSIPFIVVGALVGIWFIKRINDVWYRRFIIIVTVLTALRLIL